MSNNSFTRGSGLLEKYLTKKRAVLANGFIKSELRKGRILDIGCGFYPYFLINTNFKEKYGLDPSINLKLLENKNLQIKKAKVDGLKMPFKNNYFDVVTMLAVFEHIDKEKLVPVLKEARRILKKNGLLIITTPAPWADILLHNMAKVGLISSEEIHEHKHNKKKSHITDIIKESGFEEDKIKSGFFELYMNMWFTSIK